MVRYNKYSGKVFCDFVGLIKELAKEVRSFETKVLYGFKYDCGGGTYLRWILKEIYNIDIDYIIDDDVYSYGIEVYKFNLLDYLNPDETVIINASEYTHDFEKYGYRINQNLFNVNEITGLNNIDYYEYIEKKYDVDIIDRSIGADVGKISSDAHAYAVSRGMGMPSVCKYMSTHFPNKKVLDIGCGKGGAIIALRDFGFDCVDGIEMMDELCNVAEINLDKMNMNSSRVFNADATLFNDYHSYDVFYMYDPFGGATFKKTIHEIEDSLKKRRRRMAIVYANPWEHASVVECGIFKLVDQIKGDWSTKMVNVYVSEG